MYGNNFNQIRPRPNIQNVTPAATPAAGNTLSLDASIQQMIAAMGANSQAVNSLVAALSKGDHQHDTAFSSYPAIDLTVAHTDLLITTSRPIDWLQVWCDGGLDGISIKIGEQSNQALDMRQVQVIRVTDTNPEKIYFTNDVRQGRSKAIVYFVRGSSPLTLALAGQDISLAELAVRNGSIHSFDRRGEIIFQDDFENSTNKWVAGYVYPASCAISTHASLKKASSMELITRPILNDSVGVVHSEIHSALSRFGYEANFTINSQKGQYSMQLLASDGVNGYKYVFMYNRATKEYSYWNSSGAYTVFASDKVMAPSSDVYGYTFNKVKLVADLITKKYARIIVNNESFEIPEVPCETLALLGFPYVSVNFASKATDASAITSYLGGVIITQNEP
jgi:hypothetical protein